MPDNVITTQIIREYLKTQEGREITLDNIRKEFNILAGTKSFDLVRNIMFQLTTAKIVKPIGYRSGTYKVLVPVSNVAIFSVQRELIKPFDLFFPRDYDTSQELDFAKHVVLREGDLILISGLSNYGKTCLALNFLAENLEYSPVLMGNEYTNLDQEPTQRFLTRLSAINWVKWLTEDGKDRFTLLPVHDDHAEYVVKDKINIIDWINIESGEHFMIGNILKDIKKNVGKGISIVAIQKAEGATAGRGGQFTKDYTDCELLIDKFTDMESLLTIGKVKESLKSITGKTYAFAISQGIKIINFREVKNCSDCKGTKYVKGQKCITCQGKGKIDA
jgi:hypothetical protein